MPDNAPGASDFQLALDAMRDGVILWSADGRAIVANAAAAGCSTFPTGCCGRARGAST